MDELRALIDFGLVVLIWMVQLIVYPSFRHSASTTFTDWHAVYSVSISLLVIPLMLAQVAIIGYQLFIGPNWAAWLAALLVALIWLCTFFQAVPLHGLLGQGIEKEVNTERLIAVNWIRTILWSVVFGLG
jgi:hypothetical protein